MVSNAMIEVGLRGVKETAHRRFPTLDSPENA